MEIRILGAHQTEIGSGRPTALLVDGTLALDAGGLCSALGLPEQRRLRAVLITHWHYDHIKDLPMLGMNFAYHGCLDVYGTAASLEAVSTHLLDGKLYPDFRQWPDSRPSLRLVTLEEHRPVSIEGYDVLALPVPHSVPSVGFHVAWPGGKSLFFTGDTAGGLSPCWEAVAPDLLVTEMTFPGGMEERARRTMHLSPQLLRADLLDFRRLRGYLPRVILIHLDPAFEPGLAGEVDDIARELGASITLGQEGMAVTV